MLKCSHIDLQAYTGDRLGYVDHKLIDNRQQKKWQHHADIHVQYTLSAPAPANLMTYASFVVISLALLLRRAFGYVCVGTFSLELDLMALQEDFVRCARVKGNSNIAISSRRISLHGSMSLWMITLESDTRKLESMQCN